MSLQRTSVVAAAAIALTACLGLPARAQAPKPAADNEPRTHRLVIENGSSSTVHYISKDLSPGEESALRNLERAENGLAAAGQLMDLRSLYVKNELALERRRGQVNPLLYGYSSQHSASAFAGGYADLGGYPYGSFGAFGYPYGMGGFGSAWGSSASSSALNSLAPGIGNEGVIKNEMARTLTDPSASAAYAQAARAYDAAVARVADTRVGKSIGLVAHEQVVGPRVTLVMKKGNENIAGNLVNDDGEWITVDTDKEEVTVRKADVDRITRVKSNVKPASR
jgi:hypothetical protein